MRRLRSISASRIASIRASTRSLAAVVVAVKGVAAKAPNQLGELGELRALALSIAVLGAPIAVVIGEQVGVDDDQRAAADGERGDEEPLVEEPVHQGGVVQRAAVPEEGELR